jgi:RNA polymerase sigma factor (sigma-70 family)
VCVSWASRWPPPGPYRVAINLTNSWLRRRMAERRARARLGARAAGAHLDPDPADAVAIRRAVAALPRRQRTALVLRYYADLPVAEVAALMGCAPGTVKSLTSKA